jgi:hypothetical protein
VPENDDIFSRPLTPRTPSGGNDLQQFVQRPTMGWHSDAQGALVPWGNTDPYQSLLPTAGDIRGEVTQQRADKPWYVSAFDFLDQLTGGQAIRAFVKDLAPGQENPFWGAAKHLPFIHYLQDEDVQAADIREAWGDTNARDGWKNAAINTVIDIVSNPLMLFGSPFAVTKAGMAAASAAGATRLLAGGAKAGVTLAGDAMKLAEGLVSIGKGLETGQRAMYTFNMFGKELFSLGKIPVGVNPHGFRSMYVATGNLIDSFFSVLHSNPLLKPISGVFTFATGISDPLHRAMFGGATRAAEAARNSMVNGLSSILESSTTAEGRKFITTESGVWDAMLHMAQVGIHNADDAASFAGSVAAPHLWIGRGKVQDLLKKDPHFAALYTKAWEEVAQPAGIGTDAIRELYTKYSVPLEPEMLAHADLPGRHGVELSEFERAANAQVVRGAEGAALPMGGEIQRAEISREIIERNKAVVGETRKKVLDSYDLLQQHIKNGTTSLADTNRYLSNHANAMDAASEMSRFGMLLGTAIEPAVGPHVHRLMNPRLSKILDRQLFQGAEAAGGRKAVNIISGFMKDQNYASLTTAEANAIFWNLGTKITAFTPLKDIVERDAAAPGLVDQVMAKIYDLPFIKAMRRSPVPGDVDVANLFITNPVLNDYDHFLQIGQQVGARALFQSVFKGPLPVDELDLGKDVSKVLEYERAGHRIIIPNPEPQKILETRAVGTATQDIMDVERVARQAQAREAIRSHMEEQIAGGTTEWAAQERHLRQGSKMSPDISADSELVESSADNIGVALVKKSTRDLKDSRYRSQALELMQNPGAAKGTSGAYKFAEPPAATVAAEKANLEAMWANDGVKEQAKIAERIPTYQSKLKELDARTEANEAAGAAGTKEGWEVGVERGRIRMLRREISQALDDNKEMLLGKYKDQDSFIKASIPERVAEEKALQSSLGSKLSEMKDNLATEADSISDKIDQISGQARFQAKRGRADLANARGKTLTAMQMNTEISILHEADKRGALALDELPDNLRERYLSRLGTKAYVFKSDDWAAVEGFWKNWTHADDWGQNKIVDVLRKMRNVWAPYTAVNGLGLMPRLRDLVTGAMINMMGGFRNFSAYGDSFRMMRGWLKAVDKPGEATQIFKDGFIRRMVNGVEERLSDAEAMQFLQSRGGIDHVGMFGEITQNAGDVMELAQSKFGKGQWLEGGKVMGKQTAIPAALTDLPSAILPLRKAKDSVYGRWGLEMTKFIDGNTRVANFVDAWKRGMSLDEAVDHMMKWTYDSRRNLTTLERQRIATFIPFYSWAKFAISRSVETFFSHPGRMTWINTARSNFMKSVLPGETAADPADVEAVLPRYLAQNYGVPFRNGAKGPEFLLLGSWLPTGEMQQLVDGMSGGGIGGAASGIANYIGSKLHPAIKTAIEVARNKSFSQEDDIEKFPGQSDEFLGMSIDRRTTKQLLQNFRFLYELDRANLLGVSESQALRHGTATDEEPSYISRLAHSVFGIVPKTYPQSIEQAVAIKKRAAMQELGTFAGLLKNRAEHPERVASAEDADALRTLIKQGAARVARMESVSASFPPDQPAVKKKRQKFGPLTESLTPR